MCRYARSHYDQRAESDQRERDHGHRCPSGQVLKAPGLLERGVQLLFVKPEGAALSWRELRCVEL
jgi:hypothetical protein